VAAGPGIASAAERTTLSIYDVTPTLLAGLGWPVAEDLAGEARVELFEDDTQVVMVSTYRSSSSQADARPDEIDTSTEEQLRALGYVD
jgi:arylsulfatase A-like enzyme